MYSRPTSLTYPCPKCRRWFKNKSGLMQHVNAKHPASAQPSSPTGEQQDIFDGETEAQNADWFPPNSSPVPDIKTEFFGAGDKLYRNYHKLLNGRPCDARGAFLPEGASPSLQEKAANDWSPFGNRLEFELADFLYTRCQMPGVQIDTLLDIWAASLIEADVYHTIDRIELGDVKWDNFTVRYTGDRPADGTPPWMDNKYEVYFRNPHKVAQDILGNPNLSTEMDYCPYREFSSTTDERQWCDFMSGDWAWNQADIVAQDPATHRSVFVPVILGSDKTTVSVATGQNDFYPLYLSVGNVHNNVRHAHRNALVLVGFLAMPKIHAKTTEFRQLRRQLFHSSLLLILQSLKPFMTTPDIVRFGDGHYRRVIYELGPYIADYEEQVLLTCIVRGWCAKCLATRQDLDAKALYRCQIHTESLITQLSECFGLGRLWDEYGIVGELLPFTNDFPRADIHELIAPDLLHLIIKGAFKDHFIEWVEWYIRATYGRNFKQWTGDDLMALMKVYLPAIEGHVPCDVVRALRALLEFCCLVRRNIITETTLAAIDDALERYHQYCEVFYPDTVSTFSLPRQHAMTNYPDLIHLFGALNGLCSSITESKHIKAVKQPYRRSNHHNALGRMLTTNQQLDKLAHCRVDFKQREMLDGTYVSHILQILAHANQPDARLTQGCPSPADDNSPSQEQEWYRDGCPVDKQTHLDAQVKLASTHQRKRARTVADLSVELEVPQLRELVQRFLFQMSNPQDPRDLADIPLHECPMYDGNVKVFNAASTTFYAPSDLSGIGGMRREMICFSPSWRHCPPRLDCVFVTTNPEVDGMQGMSVVRILAFFSFRTKDGEYYPYTGMWIVRPGYTTCRQPDISVIHVDTIYRAAHLIPVYGTQEIPPEIGPHHSYDIFRSYYVNKYIDHHAFELTS
ncbi:hypothetical protein OG21DRAFT_1477479 [Imleria badia]|nr:hypothetical protein OG21DRAFT_1477479 [Imleria badia]